YRADGRGLEPCVRELGLGARSLRAGELELGLCRRDLLVAEAGARKRERFFRGTQPRGGLVAARLRLIDAARGREPALVQAALARELLLGVAQRRPRLPNVRLGALDLLRPAAAAVHCDAGLRDADLRERRAERVAIRRVVELGEKLAGLDPVALLAKHRCETPRHAKAEIHLADIDVAVQGQRA